MTRAWLVERDVAYTAGKLAPMGYYCRVDLPGGEVIYHEGGRLPASCDGQRALYAPVEPWLTSQSRPEPQEVGT